MTSRFEMRSVIAQVSRTPHGHRIKLRGLAGAAWPEAATARNAKGQLTCDAFYVAFFLLATVVVCSLRPGDFNYSNDGLVGCKEGVVYDFWLMV